MKQGRTILAVLLLLLAAGCSAEKEQSKKTADEPSSKTSDEADYTIIEASAQQIEHIQGIGYPGNDTGLYLSSSDGLKFYKDGIWHETTSLNHDYMGFQAVKEGFIVSGQPDKNSVIKNPLGIVKSTDKGASFKNLAFSGTSSFPFLVAGYDTNIIYMINQDKSEELEAGVYRSQDAGKTWETVSLKGLEADTLGMIAAHPTHPEIMAMSTRSGIFFSQDRGETVKLVSDPVMATALAFTENSLYYAYADQEKVQMSKIDFETMENSQIKIPFLSYDNPITYIAADNKSNVRLAISTYLKDLYESADSGANWQLLLKNGRIE
ncbi:F510_1955 family glycosylhydrolase [Cytobacillus sp. BC1816]|uniref:F510_1955 family glycosylhydrolase n=1 Tax=Cytobacillus sp. BC1816 TaxID=3440154 RepID=UPI003F512AB9